MYQLFQVYVIYPTGDVFDWKFFMEKTLGYSINTVARRLRFFERSYVRVSASREVQVILRPLSVVNPFHFNVYN